MIREIQETQAGAVVMPTQTLVWMVEISQPLAGALKIDRLQNMEIWKRGPLAS
jgi:hypothetical protein